MSAAPKILLVDDEKTIRKALCTMLEKMGYRVVTAANGLEGLERFKRESPALVLTDLLMPQMDGLDFIAALREIEPLLPIVVISGAGDLKSAVAAMQRGAWDYVQKPGNFAELKHIIGRAFERARLNCGNEPDTGSRSLRLLLAEDDPVSREILLSRLEGQFKQIFVAADGNEGFRLFCEHSPDIVLTDQMMPGVSGLDLMRNIRASGAKTPIVLMTSTIDNEILLEAINIGVERFVPKPFNFDQLSRTLDTIARGIVNERLLEHHRQQEVELLRYRDAYNAMQQESAMRKERHVVRHDLRNQALAGANGVRWGINVAYSPHDIMCGDGYSVRNLFDGRQLIFIVDAMGSGMSASLTAMLATSFVNYQVENLHLWEVFTLRILLHRFKEYLSGMLLEEEAISCGFFLVDLEKEELEAALFGMPPLLQRRLDGSVQRICGDNPPLGVYRSEISISTMSLTEVAELLIVTDGVSDALLVDGGSYREELENDFRAVSTLSSLLLRFKKRVVQGATDDLTLINLRRLDFASCWQWHGAPLLSQHDLFDTLRSFLNALAGETELREHERIDLETVLLELFTAALAENGTLPERELSLHATLWRGAEKPLLLVEAVGCAVRLPDAATDTDEDEMSGHEAGLGTISGFSDALFAAGSGSSLVVLKTLAGRDRSG